MTPLKNTINGHLNASTSKWWEHLRRSHQDIRLDQVHPSFGGFGTGSSNRVKPLDPKTFHIWRENRDGSM